MEIELDHFSNSNSIEENVGFICSAPKCNRIGIHVIKLIYIDKTGHFCSKHKEDLERNGLISPTNTIFHKE